MFWALFAPENFHGEIASYLPAEHFCTKLKNLVICKIKKEMKASDRRLTINKIAHVNIDKKIFLCCPIS